MSGRGGGKGAWDCVCVGVCFNDGVVALPSCGVLLCDFCLFEPRLPFECISSVSPSVSVSSGKGNVVAPETTS